jgi:hypothetical protein
MRPRVIRCPRLSSWFSLPPRISRVALIPVSATSCESSRTGCGPQKKVRR